MKISIEFQPRDLWIGAYHEERWRSRHVWICFVPMIAIHVWWRT